MNLPGSIAAALVAALLLVPSGVNHAAAGEARTITVHGTGLTITQPDLAEISVGTVSRATRVSTALADNNEKTARILALAAQLGVAERDMQTTDFSLYAVFGQDQHGAPTLEIVGHDVRNTVSIKLRDTNRLGELLEELTLAGANEIQSIRFDVSDRETPAREARRSAFADALAKAALYAKEADVTLGPVMDISESDTAWRPPVHRKAMVAYADLKGVPVASGLVEFIASVTVRFAIGGK